ncbi:MAG: hypothetical protein AAFQ40_10530 [Cyanobacteria bacterium J06623_5]
MGSSSIKGAYSNGFRWQFSVSVVAFVSAGMMVNPLSAIAAELRDWQYDTQTQVLTLTLPEAVTPTVSVVAPDQLLLELPNTQVGDVMGQTVGDGLVENIVLEQATPETVWMVMEFAAGTVLSASQSATPLATGTAEGEQQWQVRPTLIAASRQAASPSVTGSAAALESGGPVESSASQLREPVGAIAQAPDFSDLPILEPAMPIDEPVYVPPLEPVAAPTVSPEEPAEAVAETEDAADEDPSGVAVEVIPAERPQDIPLISQPAPRTSGQAVAPAQPTDAPVDNALPLDPPFIGDLEGSDQRAPSAVALPNELPVSAEPGMDDLPVVEADVRSPNLERPNSVSVPSLETAPAASAPSTPAAPSAPVRAPEPLPQSQIASGSTVGAAAPSNAVPTDETGRVVPSAVSRWPEPIPFGQPLP